MIFSYICSSYIFVNVGQIILILELRFYECCLSCFFIIETMFNACFLILFILSLSLTISLSIPLKTPPLTLYINLPLSFFLFIYLSKISNIVFLPISLKDFHLRKQFTSVCERVSV